MSNTENSKMVKLGTKLTRITTLILAVVVITTVAFVYVSMANVIKVSYTADVENAVGVLEKAIGLSEANASKYADLIASNEVIVNAVNSNDYSAGNDYLMNYLIASDAIFAMVTDENGTVIASTNDDFIKKDVSKNSIIELALAGNSGVEFEENENMPFGIIGFTPIENSAGEIIGSSFILYSLEDNNFVDSLKETANSEFTVFKGKTRLSTTIVHENERVIGTDAADIVVERVIENGDTYSAELDLFGDAHITEYRPLKDTEGNIIGMLFAGKNIQEIKNTERNSLFISIFIAFGLFLIGVAIQLICIRKSIGNPLNSLSEIVADIALGKLHIGDDNYKVEVIDTNDEIGALSRQLANTVYRLREYIGEITYVLNEIESGNLVAETKVDYDGDFDMIKIALSNISLSLRTTIRDIQISADQVSIGSDRIAAGSEELASGSDEQTGEISKLADFISNISVEVNHTAQVAIQAKIIANEAGVGVEESNRQMSTMTSAMEEISLTSKEIEKVIKAIDDIAFQTNILALNAAVEAARAGVAGKGFAVVADEVRNLAGKSAEAVKQTTILIQNSVRAVGNGSKIAIETAESLDVVVKKSRELITLIDVIASDAESEAAEVKQINNSVVLIGNVTEQNSANAQESASAAEELSGQSELLIQKIEHFKH